jgi:hypothetical protein
MNLSVIPLRDLFQIRPENRIQAEITAMYHRFQAIFSIWGEKREYSFGIHNFFRRDWGSRTGAGEKKRHAVYFLYIFKETGRVFFRNRVGKATGKKCV